MMVFLRQYIIVIVSCSYNLCKTVVYADTHTKNKPKWKKMMWLDWRTGVWYDQSQTRHHHIRICNAIIIHNNLYLSCKRWLLNCSLAFQCFILSTYAQIGIICPQCSRLQHTKAKQFILPLLVLGISYLITWLFHLMS